MKGLEPPRLAALDPKSSSATNYDTSAIIFLECKYNAFIETYIVFLELFEVLKNKLLKKVYK